MNLSLLHFPLSWSHCNSNCVLSISNGYSLFCEEAQMFITYENERICFCFSYCKRPSSWKNGAAWCPGTASHSLNLFLLLSGFTTRRHFPSCTLLSRFIKTSQLPASKVSLLSSTWYKKHRKCRSCLGSWKSSGMNGDSFPHQPVRERPPATPIRNSYGVWMWAPNTIFWIWTTM